MKLAELNKGENLDNRQFPFVLNLNTGENYLTLKATIQIMKELEKAFEEYKKKYGVRSDKYDAYYDKDSGIWLEEGCNAKNCEYCKDRPENAFTNTEGEE